MSNMSAMSGPRQQSSVRRITPHTLFAPLLSHLSTIVTDFESLIYVGYQAGLNSPQSVRRVVGVRKAHHNKRCVKGHCKGRAFAGHAIVVQIREQR